jgi:hypothetical protein
MVPEACFIVKPDINFATFVGLSQQADIDARAANKQDVTDLEPHFALPLTINIKFIEDKKGRSWHGPVPVKCSAPFAKIPPIEEIVEAITRFKAVKSDGVEKIAEPEGKKKRAR